MSKNKKVIIENKNKKEVKPLPEFRKKCKQCKSIMGFHLHMCELGGVSEYIGCKECNDYCTRCKGFEHFSN